MRDATIRLPKALLVGPVFLLVASAGLLAAHLLAADAGKDLTRALLFIEHLFDIALTLAFMVICLGGGALALAKSGIRFSRPIEEVVFAVATGTSLVATSLLVLGLLGALQPVMIAALLVIVALLARREIQKTPALISCAIREIIDRSTGPPLGLLGLGVFAAIALILVILASAPPTDWDTLMYHIQIPAESLDEARIHVPEDNLHVSRIGLTNMLYLPLLAAGSSSAPAILSACLALLLGMAVFSFCARFLGGRTASACLAGLWGTTTILLVAITPRVDVTLAFFLFLAHYALMIALSSPGERKPFYLAAVLLGSGFGVKFHAIPYVVALAPFALWTAWTLAGRLALSIAMLLRFVALLGVASLPWLLKNWVLLRAPLYPFFADSILQPWLVPFFGSRLVPDSVNPDIYGWVWELRKAFNLRDVFLHPERLTIESEGSLYFTNPVLLLLPLWAFCARNRNLNWLLVTGLLYMAVVLVPFPHTNLRYLLPGIIPLTIVAFHALGFAFERLFPKRSRLALAIAVFLVLVPTSGSMILWFSVTDSWSYFMGAKSADNYLTSHPLAGAHVRAVQAVNSRIPSNGRVLLLYEARGYYFRSAAIQDNGGTNWSLLAVAPHRKKCLEGSDITHVLLNRGALSYFIWGGLDLTLVQWEEFRQFQEECLKPIYKDPNYTLYRITTPSPPFPNAQAERPTPPTSGNLHGALLMLQPMDFDTIMSR